MLIEVLQVDTRTGEAEVPRSSTEWEGRRARAMVKSRLMRSLEEVTENRFILPQVTPEMVASRWEEITSMEEKEAPETHQEATGLVMTRIAEAINEEQDAGEKGVKDAIGYVSKPYNFRYSFR